MPDFGQQNTGRFFNLRANLENDDVEEPATPSNDPLSAPARRVPPQPRDGVADLYESAETDDAPVAEDRLSQWPSRANDGSARVATLDAGSAGRPEPSEAEFGGGAPNGSNGSDLADERLGSIPHGRGLATLLDRTERLLKPHNAVDLTALVGEIHELLLQSIDLERLHRSDPDDAEESVRIALAELLATESVDVPPEDHDLVIEMVRDEVLGLGPIDPLIKDSTVQEIMVNAPDTVYVERDGVLYRSDIRFRDDAHVRRVADRILAPIGRRIDEGSPMVDARLPDGSRVNITVPPATPRHATITIRKFRQDRLSLEDLMSAGTMDERMAEFIGVCTANRLNILISGGTGTGKTTLLNAVSSFIPRSERIITIEDPLELTLQQPHVVSMEARPADLTGRHEIMQRDLLRNSLRMRPDRIIVGEVRGPEAFEMLQAMNTGHDGSMSTVHANTGRDALSRIENMVLMAGFELPVTAIREQVASALHMIIQMERGADGVRRIVAITEVTGMEGNTITMQDIFRWELEGRDEDGRLRGRFTPTGIRPTFSEYLAIRGRDLPAEMFLEGALA